MLNKIDFENELQNIINNNLLKELTDTNITRLRDEFRIVILKAKQLNVNISYMFPIVAECGYDHKIEFNYNGSVFLIKPNYTIMIFNSYGSDSIC